MTITEQISNDLNPGIYGGCLVDALGLAFDLLTFETTATNSSVTSNTVNLDPVHETTNSFTSIHLENNSNVSNKSAGHYLSSSIRYNKVIVLVTDGETEIPIDKIRYVERTIIPKLVEAHCSVYIACIGSSDITTKPSDIKTENSLFFQHLSLLTNGNYIESDKNHDFSPLLRGTVGITKNRTVTCGHKCTMS